MNAIRLLATGLLTLSPLIAPELTEESFGKWFAWRKIPWRRTLWEAALEAQKRDMPILLWAMNGHPLGCT